MGVGDKHAHDSDHAECQMLRLKCTEFDLRWRCARDTAGEELTAVPRPLAVFKGLLLGAGKGKWREGEGRKERERGGDGEGRGKRKGP